MKKIIRIGLLLVLLIGLGGGAFVYMQAFRDNVNPAMTDGYALLIPRNASFESVLTELKDNQVLKSPGSFEQVSKIRKYDQLVKPGRYIIKPGLGNWDLVGKLRSGDQDQMKLRFGTHRTTDKLAAEIAEQLEFSEDMLKKKMADPEFLSQYDLKPETVRNLFIPNTYFVYWTMSPEELFGKLKGNFDGFWNADRKAKAAKLNMSVHEVVTLASIVQAETYMKDERPTVAGLYLNRIRDGIPLQADPTVIYAVGDFTIKRVLKKHLEFESPYNTYLHRGLPPGPINNPETSSIDGVLNPEAHKYYYMCAKADFSGFHAFAKSLSQHNANARKYQRALNERNVYR